MNTEDKVKTKWLWPIVILVVLTGLFLSRCSDDETTSTAPHELPSKSQPSSRPLPDEYIVLAKNLALEMHASPDEFRDDMNMSQIMAEGHAAIMELRRIESSDQDITYITEQTLSAYTEALARFQRINELPKPPGSGELLVSSFVDGFFGNVFGGYSRGLDAEEKQNAIVAELYPLMAAIEKGDAAQQLLPKVAEKYSATFSDSTRRISVDFDESWGAWGPNDWFYIHNAGPELRNCTISVTMTGISGEKRTNVHFVPVWAKNSWMYARYEGGEQFLDRRIGRETVTLVQKVDIVIYSPTFATLIAYTYQGKEKDKDIAERCEKLTFSGRYQPFKSGFLWDTQRGAEFTLDGIPYLPKCRADVMFRSGGQSKAWYWEFDSWRKGETKRFITDSGDLSFDPTHIDLALTFPGFSYKHSVTLKVE